MFDFKDMVLRGAAYCVEDPHDAATMLATRGLNARLPTARRVAAAFPDFASVVHAMERTEGHGSSSGEIGDGMVREYQALLGFLVPHAPIMADTDFLALLVGMVGFMERLGRPEDNEARTIIDALAQQDSVFRDRNAIALVLMGMWFADYEGFRKAVRCLADELGQREERGHEDI